MTRDRHLAAVADPPARAVPASITVVIGVGHPMLRESLRSLLETDPEVVVAGVAGDLALTREHALGHRPDAIVLDLRMRDGSGAGTGTVRTLREQLPSTPIVVIGFDDSAGFAQRVLAAGANGYVLQERATEDLPAAVKAVARGEEYVSMPVADRLAADRQSSNETRLTPRETEVLRLVALGHTSGEIADQLSLSPRTVETHRAHIHRKLAVRTRAELVSHALSCGLLST